MLCADNFAKVLREQIEKEFKSDSQGEAWRGGRIRVLVVKDSPASAGDVRDMGSIPRVRKIPWAWPAAPVFLPGASHGQRSLVGCRPWGHIDSDSTEGTKRIHTHTW